MLWVSVENLYCRVTKADEPETRWLARFLTFTLETGNPNAAPLTFLHARWGTFPTGFLPAVRRQAALDGVVVEVFDRRPQPQPPKLDADLAWLRDYQRDATMALLKGVRGILHVPTAGGKTEVAIALAQLLPWARFLFLVHRKDLLAQAAARLHQRTGEVAGLVGDGVFEPRRFTCATFQTIFRRLDDPPTRDLLAKQTDAIIVDECHIVPAHSYWRVVMRARSAYFRCGMSGTPLLRTDRRDVLIVAAMGPVLYRIKPQILIEQGVLSQPRIRLIPCRQHGLVDLFDWHEVYRRGVVESAQRNAAVVQAVLRAQKPCLVFVKEIDHGRRLEKALLAAGVAVAVEFVWGADSLEARQAAVRRLRRGDTQVVICSVIWQEGIDIPEVRSVVIAAGGRSAIAALQRLGRGMRVAKGKSEVELWDFRDGGHRWLKRHTDARVAAYMMEGFEVNEWTPEKAQIGIDTHNGVGVG